MAIWDHNHMALKPWRITRANWLKLTVRCDKNRQTLKGFKGNFHELKGWQVGFFKHFTSNDHGSMIRLS